MYFDTPTILRAQFHFFFISIIVFVAPTIGGSGIPCRFFCCCCKCCCIFHSFRFLCAVSITDFLTIWDQPYTTLANFVFPFLFLFIYCGHILECYPNCKIDFFPFCLLLFRKFNAGIQLLCTLFNIFVIVIVVFTRTWQSDSGPMNTISMLYVYVVCSSMSLGDFCMRRKKIQIFFDRRFITMIFWMHSCKYTNFCWWESERETAGTEKKSFSIYDMIVPIHNHKSITVATSFSSHPRLPFQALIFSFVHIFAT